MKDTDENAFFVTVEIAGDLGRKVGSSVYSRLFLRIEIWQDI